VQGAHTFGREQSHLTDGLANASFLIHLAVASLGLTSEWVSIHIQEPYKRILNIPDLLMVYLIIPIGHPDVPAREGVRRPLEHMVHRERYDMSKYMSNEDVIRYLYSLREATVPVHSASRGVTTDQKK
jgi:5,6-dimethylbenzimidazole synthase